MRSFKCLALGSAHLASYMSPLFVQQKQVYNDNFLSHFFLIMGCLLLILGLGTYILVAPVCLKHKNLQKLALISAGILYAAAISVCLYIFQYMLSRETVIQLYLVDAGIGLQFLILVLFDNMKQDIDQEYMALMHQIDEQDDLEDSAAAGSFA